MHCWQLSRSWTVRWGWKGPFAGDWRSCMCCSPSPKATNAIIYKQTFSSHLLSVLFSVTLGLQPSFDLMRLGKQGKSQEITRNSATSHQTILQVTDGLTFARENLVAIKVATVRSHKGLYPLLYDQWQAAADHCWWLHNYPSICQSHDHLWLAVWPVMWSYNMFWG